MAIFPNKGGGASRPVYIDSMSTYIKEVYSSAKKEINDKGRGGVLADPYILFL